MQISLSRFILFLILSSTAFSQSVSPTSPQQPAPVLFPCLTRAEKEKIEVAFEENEACHKTLEQVTAPQEDTSWRNAVLYILGGLAAGMFLGSKIDK